MNRRDRLVRQSLRQRFVFTMLSGETFEGLLLDADSLTVHVADAFALQGQSPRLAVDGELYLPRAEIAYMQKPGVSA